MPRGARMGVLAAALVALALRLTLAAEVAPQRIGGDPRVYDATAAAIAAGHGFSVQGRPTALHPPAWPYVLGAAYALTGHGTPLDQRRAWSRPHPGRALTVAHGRSLVGRVVNALLAALAVGLLGLLALELAAPAVAVTAAVVAATLTRANGAVLLVPLALVAWPGRQWRALAGTYNATAPANRYRWRAPQRLPAADRAAARTHPEAARDRALSRLALRYIGAHPLAVVKAIPWNTARMLEIDPVSREILGAEVGSSALGAVSVAGFAVLALLVALGLATRAARRVPLWLWAAPLMLWLGTAPFAVNFSRFRWPLDPFAVLLAACALATAAQHARPRAVASA